MIAATHAVLEFAVATGVVCVQVLAAAVGVAGFMRLSAVTACCCGVAVAAHGRLLLWLAHVFAWSCVTWKCVHQLRCDNAM